MFYVQPYFSIKLGKQLSPTHCDNANLIIIIHGVFLFIMSAGLFQVKKYLFFLFYLGLTQASISTITQMTNWCPLKFIDKVAAALLHLYLHRPFAATGAPVETNLSFNSLPYIYRMSTA